MKHHCSKYLKHFATFSEFRALKKKQIYDMISTMLSCIKYNMVTDSSEQHVCKIRHVGETGRFSAVTG